MLDKRLVIMVSEQHLGEIDEYRRSQTPIPSRGEAVRQLIEKSLKELKGKSKK